MKVVVCVKTATGAAVGAQDAFQRAGRVGPAQLSAFDACAVEAALKVVEQAGGEVVIATLAGTEVLGALREALSLGARRAVALSDQRLQGSDVLATSRALAMLLARERADLYLSCPWTGDIDGSLLWVATAQRLKLPVITQARRLEIAQEGVRCQSQIESGDVVKTASLPCMVEVADTLHQPRYPTIKGRKAAQAKPVEMLSLDDLGIPPDRVGASGAATKIIELGKPPARRTPTMLEGQAASAPRIVEFLEARGLLR